MVGARHGICALALAGAAALTVALAPAQATVPPVRCGKIEVRSHEYRVSGHRVPCDFARKWSRHFLRHRIHPDGWSCVRYSAQESRIAFNCRKGGKDYYAVRA